MIRTKAKGYIYGIALSVLILVLMAANLWFGSINIPAGAVWNTLIGNEVEKTSWAFIIWESRLPQAVTALLCGAALAASGLMLQTAFNNPLAGPSILGINSGASLGVALVMLAGGGSIATGVFTLSGFFSVILGAFIGSMVVMGLILFFSTLIKSNIMLLITGIMIGYICSAVTDFVVTFAEDSDIVNLHGWSQGSFSGMNWSNVKVAAVVIGVTILITFFMSKPIGAYQLGEAYAQSMGVNIRFFRIMLILTSSVLSACVTAFAGPISFVGIAVPYLVKRSLGTSRPLIVIPATFLGGGVFCMMCDLIARMAFAPLELNISTVTSIFGAPVVIFMMLHRKKGN